MFEQSLFQIITDLVNISSPSSIGLLQKNAKKIAPPKTSNFEKLLFSKNITI